MDTKFYKSTILIYVLCLISFSIVSSINHGLVEYYLCLQKTDPLDLELLDQSRMIAIIIGIGVLFLSYNFFEPRKILATNLIFYLASQIGLIISSSLYGIKLNHLFISVTSISIIFQLIMLFITRSELTSISSIPIFLGSLAIGYVTSEIILHFFLYQAPDPDLNYIMIYNLAPVLINIFLIGFNENFKFQVITEPSNYSRVSRYIALESVIGFVSWYVIIILLHHLGSSVPIYNSLPGSILNNNYIIIGAIFLLSIYPLSKLMKFFNHPILVILNLFIMLILLLIMYLWQDNTQISLTFCIIIVIQLYQLFIWSLTSIMDKFYKQDQFGAVLIFFLISSTGILSGYVTIHNLEKSLEENLALYYCLSIPLFISLAYFCFRFINDKLYLR